MAEQATVLESEGHAVPPLSPASLMNRDLCEVPTVHSLLHAVHAPHGVTAQSTGQTGVSEQAPASTVLEHATPPPAAGVSMVRIRSRDPAPHVREQELHASHEPWEQSIGHAKVAQLRACVSTGQEAPPLLSDSTERTRIEAPVPQLTGQADHPPHPLTAQSSGHSQSPQPVVSDVSGQLSPCPTCGCVTLPDATTNWWR